MKFHLRILFELLRSVISKPSCWPFIFIRLLLFLAWGLPSILVSRTSNFICVTWEIADEWILDIQPKPNGERFHDAMDDYSEWKYGEYESLDVLDAPLNGIEALECHEQK